jgi:branched-chain amino acid transport system ATP-binding protein
VLEVRGLHAWYGKSHILQGVDLEVAKNEIVAVLGRNGTGRSTLLKSIMGAVQCKGDISFRGEAILGLQPFEVAAKGIGYVPEERAIFPGLTVRQNLLLGIKDTKEVGDWGFDETWSIFPQLKERADTRASVLSGGEQQMLTICRTLMGNPKLVMVDEPTEGLAPQVVNRVADLLKRIAEAGIAILLVEQKLTIALDLCHRLYVMGHGHIVFTGTPRDFAANEGVRREWLEVSDA